MNSVVRCLWFTACRAVHKKHTNQRDYYYYYLFEYWFGSHRQKKIVSFFCVRRLAIFLFFLSPFFFAVMFASFLLLLLSVMVAWLTADFNVFLLSLLISFPYGDTRCVCPSSVWYRRAIVFVRSLDDAKVYLNRKIIKFELSLDYRQHRHTVLLHASSSRLCWCVNRIAKIIKVFCLHRRT